MKRIFRGLFLLSLLLCSLKNQWFASSALAGTIDYSTFFQFRSYPFGALSGGVVGYNHLLWGSRESSRWKYGYLRPSFLLQTIGVVSRVGGRLDLSPISILNFSLGRTYGFRTGLFNPFQCGEIHCQGILGRTYFQARLVLGYKNAFLLLRARVDDLDHDERERPFVDEISRLVGSPGGDRMLTTETLLGYQLSPDWLGALFLSRSKMLDAKNSRNFGALIGQYTLKPWSFSAGPGYYHSSHDDLGLMIVAVVKWTGAPSLSLF